MEQNDSLKASMQELAVVQRQQLQILQDMAAKQSLETNLQMQQLNNNNIKTAPNFQPAATNFYPSSYMNYAPNYMPPMVPLSPAAQQQVAQFGAYSQQVTKPADKYGFLDSIFPSQSRVSNQTRTLLAMDYSSRISQGAVAGLGAGAGAAASWGLGSMLPGVLGLGAGMFGGAFAGALVDNGINEMKKQSAYEKYLMRESYRFINPNESTNTRDIAGFSLKESQNASTYMRGLSDKFYMKDSEMMGLVQKYTDGGLLKDSHDLTSFKEKVASLTKNVKAGALMLNETYDSIADLMSSLRKAGIDQKNFDQLMANGKVLGSFMGKSGSDVLRSGLGTVINGNSGTGNSNLNGTTRITDTYLYTDSWFEGLREKTNKTAKEQSAYNMMTNLGGSQASGDYIYSAQEQLADSGTFNKAAITFFDYNTSTKQFDFNKDKFKQFTSGKADYQTLMDEFSAKMNDLSASGNQGALLDWQSNGGTYIKNNLNDGDLTKMLTRVSHSFAASKGIDSANINYDQVLGLMGVSDSNMKNLLSGYFSYREDKGDQYGNNMKLQSMWESQNAEVRSQVPSIPEAVGAKWSAIKKWWATPFVNLKNDIDSAVIGFSDQIYGTSDKIMAQPDKYYSVKSGLSSFNAADVHKNFEDANNSIALISSRLGNLSSKGFNVDGKLSDYLKDSLSQASEAVSYTRDVIKNWDSVDKGVSKFKDTIVDAASKSDLSESILSALVKWNQQSGKKTTDESIKQIADKLGKLTFDYGGNKDLALAAFTGGDSTKSAIDNALTKAGYDINALRANGQQSIIQGVSISDLGVQLTDAVKKAMGDIKSTNVVSSVTAGVDGSFLTKDLLKDSGVTADDLNSIIDANTQDKQNSLMKGQGKAFYDAAKSAGIDPLYFLSHAAQETGWGTSDIARQKGNFFGIGAFDSSPMASAYAFGSGNLTDTLTLQADWIKKNYLSAGQNTLYSMRWNNGNHQYATDGHESNDPLSWDEKIAGIMSSGIKTIGKTIGTLGDNSSVSSSLDLATAYVSKDKDGNIIAKTAFEAAPSKRTGQKTLQDLYDTQNLIGGMTTSADQYNESRNKLESEVLDSGNVWDKMRGGQLWDRYKKALDGQIGHLSITASETDPTRKKIREDAIAKAKKEFEDFQNERSGGKYDQLKKLDSDWSQLQQDRAGAGQGKLSTYQEGLVIQQIGKQLGINQDNGEGVDDYYNRLITGVQNYYNSNYDAMENSALNQQNPHAGLLNDAGKKFNALDMTDKAATYKNLQILQNIESIKSGLKGNLSNSHISANSLFNGSESDKLQHLFYKKDKKGNATSDVYYDPYNTNDTQMTADDLLNWQSQGATVDYLSAAKNLVNGKGSTKLGDGATYDEIANATKETYKSVMQEGFQTASALNKAQNDLKKSGSANGLSDTEIQKVLDAVKNKDTKVLQGMRSELAKEGKQGREGTDGARGDIQNFIDLIDKMKGLKTDDFQKVLDQIGKIQQTSADVGKGGKMLGGMLGESGKVAFEEAIQSVLSPELKDLKLQTKDVMDTLVNGGKVIKDGKTVLDDKGNVVNIDAHDMQTLSEKISESMSSALKDELDKNQENLKDNATKMGDEKLATAIDQLTELKNALVDNDGKSVGDKTKLKGADLEKLKSQEQELEGTIISKYLQDLADLGKTTSDATAKADKLGESADKFGTVFEKYDRSIAAAIDTMEQRISKNAPAQNARPVAQPSTSLYGSYNSSGNRMLINGD